eukprot:6469549-Amphidinium_carterae.1
MGPVEVHQSAVFYADDLATALHNPAELDRMDHMQTLVRRALHLQVKPSKMTIIVLHAERLLIIREVLQARYPQMPLDAVQHESIHLGFNLGLNAEAHAISALRSKLECRVEIVKTMGLGIPSILLMLRSLVLSILVYRMSVGIGHTFLEEAWHIIRVGILRGPPKWIPARCLETCSTNLSWPAEIPDPHIWARALMLRCAVVDFWKLRSHRSSIALIYPPDIVRSH